MSEEPRKPITDRQAEARRQNGRQSRGPITEEGKRRSSQNATTHGNWARVLYPLLRGPLREDSEQLDVFLTGYIEGLNPGNHVILRQTALDCADKAWRVTRAQRWETFGYSSPKTQHTLISQADMMMSHLAEDRKDVEIVRSLPDPSIPSDALLGPYCRLAFHFGASEESVRPLEDADAPTVMKAFLLLIQKHFVDIEDAAALLETMADEEESKAEGLYGAMRPEVVRQELDGAFSRNAERLVAHASQELDRSLKRYWQLWERLQATQPPVQASELTDDPMSNTKPPSESPVAYAQPGPDESTQKSANVTRPPAVPQPIDLKLLEEILDRRLLESINSKPNGTQTENPKEDV